MNTNRQPTPSPTRARRFDTNAALRRTRVASTASLRCLATLAASRRDSSAAMRARAAGCSTQQQPTAIGCARARRRHDPRERIHPAAGVSGPARVADCPQGGAIYRSNSNCPSGGWAIYPGGSVDISASVKAYFALKLTGHDPGSEPMQRARAAISPHGGADAVNSFTRFYLALLGQISYDQCPAVPPEVVLLPSWFPINLYHGQRLVADDHRAAVDHVGLRAGGRARPAAGHLRTVSRAAREWPPLRCPGQNGGTGPVELGPVLPHRRSQAQVLPATRLAAAAPARTGRGRTLDDRALRRQRRLGRDLSADGLEHRRAASAWATPTTAPEVQVLPRASRGPVIEEDDTIRLQPCKSPVWDTAITLRALAASGLDAEHAGRRAAPSTGCSTRKIRRRGDWAETRRRRAGRLVLRICQRVLSRRRRHDHGLMALNSQVDSAPTRRARCRELAAGRSIDGGRARPRRASAIATLDRLAAATRAGRRLGAGDAESRRRLGRLRSRQRSRVPLPCAVRRSQRHDRSQHARPDRPRAGDARPAWPPRGRSGRRSGRGLYPRARRRPTAVGSAAGA